MSNIVKYIVLGFVIRLVVIIYGEWHDRIYEVPFTDIDYKVFTDAARYMTEGGTPYNRSTYRYTPMIAFLLIPNIIFHNICGKILFCFFDILTAYLIYKLVHLEGQSKETSLKCSLIWIFNPLAIVIAARGNSDSVITCVILLTLILLRKNRPSAAGIMLGFAIHIRLYPIMYTLAIYLSLKDEKMKIIEDGRFHTNYRRVEQMYVFGKSLIKYFYKKLYPNKEQFVLALSCILHLLTLTGICYLLYGSDYLEESILYHLRRRDTRHNFSVYFYLLYLSPMQPSIFIFLPQFILIVVFSFFFGTKNNLLFCLLLETIIIVTYNPVLTSQYFVWFLSLLPPVLPHLHLSLRQSSALTSLWLAAQLAWLLPAYWLEFRGRNTFLYIWLQGIAFFCANLAVLVRFIRAYKFVQKGDTIKKSN